MHRRRLPGARHQAARRLRLRALGAPPGAAGPDLVADLGATYHHGEVSAVTGADIVVECTGVGDVVVDAVGATAPNSIVCLVGLTTGGRRLTARPDDVKVVIDLG